MTQLRPTRGGADPNKLAERELKTTAGVGRLLERKNKKNIAGGSVGVRLALTCFAPESPV